MSEPWGVVRVASCLPVPVNRALVYFVADFSIFYNNLEGLLAHSSNALDFVIGTSAHLTPGPSAQLTARRQNSIVLTRPWL